MGAFLLSFGVIFVAELGDKSQLMAMTFATRYRFWTVLGGITAATALVHLASVGLGTVVGVNLPTTLIRIVAGIAFLVFGAWTLRGDKLSEDERAKAGRSTRSAFFAVAIAFFLAELGDKTMLATFALAAQQGALPTWIGSTAGEVAANLVAVAVGRQAGHRLSPRVIRIGSAALFALAGAAVLIGAFLP